jgi:hypothetical protein
VGPTAPFPGRNSGHAGPESEAGERKRWSSRDGNAVPNEREPPPRKAKSEALDPADWRWAGPRRLKVDPAFQRLIPLQSRGEYRALEQSIRAEGCRDPLLIWKGRNVLLADVKLTQTLARRLLKTPADERKDIVRRLVELGELPRSRKAGTSSAADATEAAQSLVARLQPKGDEYAREVIRQTARLLGLKVGEESADQE